MYTIKTEEFKEFIDNKKDEWTVFASGPTKGNRKVKSISFNVDKNKVKVEIYNYHQSWNGQISQVLDKEFSSKIFDVSVAEAVDYFNNEEW